MSESFGAGTGGGAPLGDLSIAFLSVAFFGVGGANALFPEFHRQIVENRHWMTSAEFAHVIALAQIAPGPNMLTVSLIGWRLAGLAGMLVTTASLIAPTCLFAWFVGRGMGRLNQSRWFASVRAALAPIAVGLMVASGVVTARAADNDLIGALLTAIAAAYMYFLRRNPLWIIALGAVVGVLAHRAGWMTLV